MRRSTATVGRVLTALLGLVLLLGGGSAVLWRMHVRLARTLYAHADRQWYLTAGQQHWWSWTMAAIAVAATIGGVGLLAANLRPNRLGPIELAHDSIATQPHGASTLGSGALATAVATTIAENPVVQDASGRAVLDRGLPTLRIAITAKPDVSLEHLRRIAGEAVADIAAATDDAAIATQFFVHYLPVDTHNRSGSKAGVDTGL